MGNKKFKAERISKTAIIILGGKVETVFPLFGAFEERKWAEGWNPVLIYPANEIIEEGTTFKTKGFDNTEPEFIWRVSKYHPVKFLIQYLVSTENRYWTISIKCNPLRDNKTSAEVAYEYTGLNELGNKINEKSLEKMYANNLIDWEEAINSFLIRNKIDIR